MYTHIAQQHFIWEETGKYKTSHIGLRRCGKGWKSGDAYFNAQGKHKDGSCIDLNTLKLF